MNNTFGFDSGLIFSSIWSIINIGMIILFIYIAILLIRYLRRGIKYYDMQLNKKTNQQEEVGEK